MTANIKKLFAKGEVKSKLSGGIKDLFKKSLSPMAVNSPLIKKEN